MITWSRRALEDLDKIFSYVVKHFTEDKAIEILDDLKKRLTKELTSFPHIGKKNQRRFHFVIIDGNRFYFEIRNSKSDTPDIEIVLIKPRGTK